MDVAVAEDVLEQCRALGSYRVVLGGHGEPTLHPEFDHLLARSHHLGLRSYVISNGLDLETARVRLWAERRADFRFSLHAGDPKTWLAVHPDRCESDFRRLEEAIRRLSRGRRARVSTLHVVQRANVGKLEQTVHQARRLGVREILYLPVRAEGARSPVLVDPGDLASLRGELARCAALAARYGIRTNLAESASTWNLTRHGVPRTQELYSKIPCVVGYLYLEVDVDGTLRPCEGSGIVLGSMPRGDRLGAVWRSERLESFRRLGRGLPRTGRPVAECLCDECTMAPFNLAVAKVLGFARGIPAR